MGLLRVTWQRLSQLTRVRLGYAAGCLATACGAGLQFGLGIGLIVGGAVAAGSFLLLADVDSNEGGQP